MVGGPCDFSVSPSPFGLLALSLALARYKMSIHYGNYENKVRNRDHIREAFKKNVTNVTLTKVVFKIHFKPF